jgi:hypothetical protein
MSWAGIANNQCISLDNLKDAVATGVFTELTAIPTGSKQITKSEAITYVSIETTIEPIASKANNQLVVKTDLVPTGATTTTTTTTTATPTSTTTTTSTTTAAPTTTTTTTSTTTAAPTTTTTTTSTTTAAPTTTTTTTSTTTAAPTTTTTTTSTTTAAPTTTTTTTTTTPLGCTQIQVYAQDDGAGNYSIYAAIFSGTTFISITFDGEVEFYSDALCTTRIGVECPFSGLVLTPSSAPASVSQTLCSKPTAVKYKITLLQANGENITTSPFEILDGEDCYEVSGFGICANA